MPSRPPVIPPHVSEAELRAVKSEREEIEALSARLNFLKRENEVRELDIINRINAGEPVVGKLAAEVVQETGRCTPRWKDEWSGLISRMGKDVEVEEAKVKKAYPPPVKDVLVIAESPAA